MPRPRNPRRRRRRKTHVAALAALVVYGAFVFVGYRLVSGALGDDDSTAREQPAGGQSTGAAAEDRLALQAVGSRAQRSTLGVGAGTGFVAWEQSGLTLVLTSRPAGGWKTGRGRSLTVVYDATRYDGTLVRADARSGLGLVRVPSGNVAAPLWNTPRVTTLRPGEPGVLVGRRDATTTTVERVGARRVFLEGSGYATLAGSPVLNGSGRLVGVVDAGGGVVPVSRACGVIRRC